MKGIGNYRELPRTTVERRVAQLALVHGPRASIRFIDGTMYTMPLAPLAALGIKPGDTFALVTRYQGKKVLDVKIEPTARPNAPSGARPRAKVYVRDGIKITTRKT